MAIEGDALTWYQWKDGRRPFFSWNEFKAHLLTHFRSMEEEPLHEKFLENQQDATMADYRQKFEVLIASWKIGLPMGKANKGKDDGPKELWNERA